jgi:hypothetical protein
LASTNLYAPPPTRRSTGRRIFNLDIMVSWTPFR